MTHQPIDKYLRTIYEEISDELNNAIGKFPTWPTDPIHALAVLGEEFGEVTKEVLQMTYEPNKSSKERVRKEAIQTAAMALRFVASLDNYRYTPSEQHSQPESFISEIEKAGRAA